MKRILALFLCAAIFLTNCSQSQPQTINPDNMPDNASSETVEPVIWEDAGPHYNALDDTLLLAHIEDLIYTETITALDSEEYFVGCKRCPHIERIP